MKTALYAAVTARTYRKAIDDWFEDPALYRKHLPLYEEEISKCTFREFTTGFFFGKPSEKDQIYDESTYKREAVYLGMVKGFDEKGRCVIEQKNKFLKGETIEIMKPDGRNVSATVLGICDEADTEMDSAPHARQILHLALSEAPDEGDVLRQPFMQQ